MASKSELEEDWNEYHRFRQLAADAVIAGRYDEAVSCAVNAWPYVDGMMQFGRRYKSVVFETVEAIEVVLNYAPALFDKASLDRLGELLNQQKRIDRHASEDLAQRLAEARAALECAYRLWCALEHHGALDRDTFLRIWTVSERQLQAVSDVWVNMNVVSLVGNGTFSYLSLTTRMDATTQGKCLACGAIAKAPKVKLLEEQRCPRCKCMSEFVVLEPPVLAEVKS